ncbi:flagellar hook-basal body complex protein FliE [Porticoccaceae bacterium]|nr:flagellar hook-basal body complex protein FliE [Porticoccaceae bacterium]MDG2116481.1 flagellar hook-basal body complex protein FliE [Porticoccaceae bacterium]
MVNPTNMGNIEAVLGQIRQYQAQVEQGVNIAPTATVTPELKSTGVTGFADSIKGALQEVNATQQATKAMRTAYERGEDIPLTDVVMSMQKSSLAFEATLQIRNKVLKAYEEIMNMPV